jgi:hypothetical protein
VPGGPSTTCTCWNPRKRILHQTYGPLDLLQMQTRPTHRSSLQLPILAPADDVTRAALEVIDAARRGTDR